MAAPPSPPDPNNSEQQRRRRRLRLSPSNSSSSPWSQRQHVSQQQQLVSSPRSGEPGALRIRWLSDVPAEFLRLYQRQPVLRSFTEDQIRSDARLTVAPVLVQAYVRRSEQAVRRFSEGDPSALFLQFAPSYSGRVHSSLPHAVLEPSHQGVGGYLAQMAVLMTHLQFTGMELSVEPCVSESPLLACVVFKGRCSIRMCRSKREVTFAFRRYWIWDIRSEKLVASDYYEDDQELADVFAAEEREQAEEMAALLPVVTQSEQDAQWGLMHAGSSGVGLLQLPAPAVTDDSTPFFPLSDAVDAGLPAWDSRPPLSDGCDELQLAGTELPLGEAHELDGLAAISSSFPSFLPEPELPPVYAALSRPVMLAFEALPPGDPPVPVVDATALALPAEPARPLPLLWTDGAGQAESVPPPAASCSGSSSSSQPIPRLSASQSLCKLHRLLPDCERELAASVSGPGHRGIRCICWRCQLVCCVPSTDGSSPTMFRPFHISAERALLLHLIITRDEQKAAAALQSPKRRHGDIASADAASSGSSSSASPPVPSPHVTVRTRRRTQARINGQLKMVDAQGRRINRDRSLCVAGGAGESDRELLLKRLTIDSSEAEELYLYVFASGQELEMALQHWLTLARELSAVQLLCHRLREPIVMKYHHAGQEIQIDKQQRLQLRARDQRLIHAPSTAPPHASSNSAASSPPPSPPALTIAPLQVLG